MKSLVKFILESSNDVFTFINSLKFDFSETSNMPSNSIENRALKAKSQEQILIDTINNASEKYSAIGIKEYCEKNNKKYSYEIDSKLGDIVIYKDNKEVMFIDLKVSNEETYYGTPDMLSLVNFAANKDNKKYYLCSSINGVKHKLLLANDVYSYIINNKETIIASKDRKNSSTDVSKLFDKVTLKNSNKNNFDITKLYDEDFVPSFVINKI